MTLREVIREIKDFPATTTLCLLWVVVFAAMLATQLAMGGPLSWQKIFLTGIGDGHRFGDLALQDLARAEYWRLLTSTFVHFSVIHLALNLVAMYQLGTLVESWYGTPQFIFIYGLTGGGGNLVSVLIRHGIGANPLIHSGGGSVVIMGLVGLCAVAGLRSRTKMGMSLGRIMVFFMAVTAAIGIALPQVIDNWGHAGGALVGMVLGFAHNALLNAISKPTAWGRGVVTALLIAASGMAQVAADRRETPVRQEQNLVRHLAALERNYQILKRLNLLVHQRADTKILLRWLDTLSVSSDGSPSQSAALPGLRAVVLAAAGRPLTDDEQRDLLARLSSLLEQARRACTLERQKLWQLRAEPGHRRSR